MSEFTPQPSIQGTIALQLGISPGPVACPHDVFTLIGSGTIRPDHSGIYVIQMMGNIPFILGAVPPTGITIRCRMLSSGSDAFADNNTLVPTGQLVANAAIWSGVYQFPNSGGVWAGFTNACLMANTNIYTMQLHVNPAGQAITVDVNGFQNFLFHRMSDFRAIIPITGGVQYVS